jgi:uncharacterized membrane protein
MFIKVPEAHSRSLVKAVSWRLLGSIDTFVISYFVTGHVVYAASIASVESFTKIGLFYFHERAWGMIPWGRKKVVEVEDSVLAEPEPQIVAEPARA